MSINRKIAAYLLKGGFANNVLILMTGTTLAQIIPVLLSPVLTRLYSPVDYGTTTLFTTIVGIFSVVATLRYELSIMLPEKDEDALNIIAISIFLSVFMSIFLFFATISFHGVFISILNSTEIFKWLYFFPLMVFLIGVFQTMHYWCSRKKEYRSISIAHITRASFKSGFQIGAVLIIPNIGTAGLIVGSIFGQFIGTMVFVFQSAKSIFSRIGFVNKYSVLSLLKHYKKFPLINTPHSLVNTLSNNLPVMLLTAFFSSRVAGLYSLSLMAVLLPSSLISNAIGQVFYQRITEAYNNHENLYNYTKRLIKGLFIISIVPFSILFVLSPLLFGMVFGIEWLEAGEYTRVLLPLVFFTFFGAPLSYLPLTLGYQKKALCIEIVGIMIKVIALFIGSHYSNPIISISLFSASGVIILIYSITWMISLTKQIDIYFF